MTAKRRTPVVLLVGIALILILLALQLRASRAQLDETGPANAKIGFSADQGMVIAPGACLTVRWQVEHIQAVYLNDQPTVSPGFKQLCVDNRTMPVLHVEFQDGTAQDYRLEIKFLVEQPSTWLLGGVGLLLVLASLYVGVSRPAGVLATRDGIRHAPRLVLFFAGVGLLFSGIVVMMMLLELGLHFYFGQLGTREEQSAYLLSRSEIETRQSELVLPFVEYGLAPDFPGHNRLGYRGDDIQVPKPAGVYRIAVLGDSSTYGNAVPYDKTYAYDLQQVLRDEYGYKNLEVVNGGVPSYTSWNMLVDLAFRVTALQPDLVIVYAGWNDLGPREQSPDCYNSPSPFLGLDSTRQMRARSADLSPSALYRFLAIAFGWIENPALVGQSLAKSSVQCSSQIVAEMVQNTQANAPIYFERNLREMGGIAKVLGIKIMFMTWAYNVNSPFFPEVRRNGIAEHNAVTTQVAQEDGALFFDYAPIASTDKESWADVAHLSVSGNMEQAEKIAQFLVDQKVITQQHF